MTVIAPPMPLTPEDVERAGERDGKLYELIDGELKEKNVGTAALLIASLIIQRLNALYYPDKGFAVAEAMIYCFRRKDRGRKPDVTFMWLRRLPDGKVPVGDIHIAPDLVVEVLSPGNTGLELEEKLSDYLGAGIPLVWIVHPDMKTIRVYRNDGTHRLFSASDTIANELLLPGFSLPVADIFPR